MNTTDWRVFERSTTDYLSKTIRLCQRSLGGADDARRELKEKWRRRVYEGGHGRERGLGEIAGEIRARRGPSQHDSAAGQKRRLSSAATHE
jgi:hypothetical protein